MQIKNRPRIDNQLKILLGYNYYRHTIDVKQRVEAWLKRLRSHGFNVDGFVLTINPPGPRLTWEELERRWKYGDRELFGMYERLARDCEGYDVFVNCNGNDLHPEFVKCLSTFNVYCCFDDPESSSILSEPVASAYDLCMVGNIACLDMYRQWGAKEVKWWPIGYHPNDCDETLTIDKIASHPRAHDLSLVCDRLSAHRSERLSSFVNAFPEGTYYGRGWPNGFLSEEQRVPLFQQTKLGPNFHNSIGPVNSRTFVLPANGIMQICDNRSCLGKIFELGKEVIGFDDVKEAIDMTRYYLAHDNERIELAIAGWKRAKKDYNEVAVFTLLTDAVSKGLNSKKEVPSQYDVHVALGKHEIAGRRRTFLTSPFAKVKNFLTSIRR